MASNSLAEDADDQTVVSCRMTLAFPYVALLAEHELYEPRAAPEWEVLSLLQMPPCALVLPVYLQCR